MPLWPVCHCYVQFGALHLLHEQMLVKGQCKGTMWAPFCWDLSPTYKYPLYSMAFTSFLTSSLLLWPPSFPSFPTFSIATPTLLLPSQSPGLEILGVGNPKRPPPSLPWGKSPSFGLSLMLLCLTDLADLTYFVILVFVLYNFCCMLFMTDRYTSFIEDSAHY